MEWVVNAMPRSLYPRERLFTHCIGGWVGPRAGLDGCVKSRPPQPGFHPRTAQPIASRCTVYAIPRMRSWLRDCTTSRKVAGSIPDGVISIFHCHIPSGRTMALGLTHSLTEMSTSNISWGVKVAGA